MNIIDADKVNRVIIISILRLKSGLRLASMRASNSSEPLTNSSSTQSSRSSAPS